jgi:hypothetical protein
MTLLFLLSSTASLREKVANVLADRADIISFCLEVRAVGRQTFALSAAAQLETPHINSPQTLTRISPTRRTGVEQFISENPDKTYHMRKSNQYRTVCKDLSKCLPVNDFELQEGIKEASTIAAGKKNHVISKAAQS